MGKRRKRKVHGEGLKESEEAGREARMFERKKKD